MSDLSLLALLTHENCKCNLCVPIVHGHILPFQDPMGCETPLVHPASQPAWTDQRLVSWLNGHSPINLYVLLSIHLTIYSVSPETSKPGKSTNIQRARRNRSSTSIESTKVHCIWFSIIDVIDIPNHSAFRVTEYNTRIAALTINKRPIILAHKLSPWRLFDSLPITPILNELSLITAVHFCLLSHPPQRLRVLVTSRFW